ncbi:MAG TPA: hypothetical protein DDW65_06385 [Firmicutes bacterium]|nr:hypothetical protein [Bacillota bacterium]
MLLKKIIDNHGKLWGFINPLDLAVMLILFALAIKVFLDYRPAPLEFKVQWISIGLLARNVPPYLADSITIGQDVYQDSTGAYLGKVRATRINPAELLLEKNGAAILTQSPSQLDLRILVKNKGRIITGPAGYGIYFGKLGVRIGNHLKVHTLYSSVSGEIEYLRVNSREQ